MLRACFMIPFTLFIRFYISDYVTIRAGIYLFQTNNSKIRTMCKTYTKFTIKA